MRIATFNEFDGALVVESLLEHRDLWRGVVMDRSAYQAPIDLIKLRDIEHGYWNVDTVFVLSSGVDDAQLEQLANTWAADEVDWYEGEAAGLLLGAWGTQPPPRILRVWWD